MISLDPLPHPDLVPQSEEQPPALAPLTVRAYTLRSPLPMTSFAGPGGDADVSVHHPGHIEVRVTAPAAGPAVVREAYAAGWKATVDGASAEVQRADGGHIAVAVPAGTHAVVLDYDPPGLRLGALVGSSAGAGHDRSSGVAGRRRRASETTPTAPPAPP